MQDNKTNTFEEVGVTKSGGIVARDEDGFIYRVTDIDLLVEDDYEYAALEEPEGGDDNDLAELAGHHEAIGNLIDAKQSLSPKRTSTI